MKPDIKTKEKRDFQSGLHHAQTCLGVLVIYDGII